MTQEFFFGNYLAYPRCIKVAVGLEIDLDFNNNPQPVGPPNNEIWYTTTDDEIYDLESIIATLVGAGATYNGPSVLSNEYDEDLGMYVMVFDDDVTVLSDLNPETMTAEGPFFATNPKYGMVCNVETIILPKTVTRIGSGAFGGCSGLTSIEIPNSVTSIGEYAFYSCSNLTSVTIPNSVTSIEGLAFCYCVGLTSLMIPNSVTSIESEVFTNCTGLKSVTIGNSVASIGWSTFNGCASLLSIICEATTPPTLSENVFDNTNDCPIYVPVQSVDAYKSAEKWSQYADRIQAIQ